MTDIAVAISYRPFVRDTKTHTQVQRCPCKHTHTVSGAHKHNLATVNASALDLQLLFSISAAGGEGTASIDRVSPERLSTAS